MTSRKFSVNDGDAPRPEPLLLVHVNEVPRSNDHPGRSSRYKRPAPTATPAQQLHVPGSARSCQAAYRWASGQGDSSTLVSITGAWRTRLVPRYELQAVPMITARDMALTAPAVSDLTLPAA